MRADLHTAFNFQSPSHILSIDPILYYHLYNHPVEQVRIIPILWAEGEEPGEREWVAYSFHYATPALGITITNHGGKRHTPITKGCHV